MHLSLLGAIVSARGVLKTRATQLALEDGNVDEPPREEEKTFPTEAPVVARDLAVPCETRRSRGKLPWLRHCKCCKTLVRKQSKNFPCAKKPTSSKQKVQKKPRSALHRSATMKKPVSKLAAGKQKRKAASEEAKAEQRLRSHHQRGCGQKHICKSIWVSEHFLKFRCHAAVARSTFASQNVKIMKVSDVKWHAVVTRSTFASQNVKIMRTF